MPCPGWILRRAGVRLLSEYQGMASHTTIAEKKEQGRGIVLHIPFNTSMSMAESSGQNTAFPSLRPGKLEKKPYPWEQVVGINSSENAVFGFIAANRAEVLCQYGFS